MVRPMLALPEEKATGQKSILTVQLFRVNFVFVPFF